MSTIVGSFIFINPSNGRHGGSRNCRVSKWDSVSLETKDHHVVYFFVSTVWPAATSAPSSRSVSVSTMSASLPNNWPTKSWTCRTSWSTRSSTICHWPTISPCCDSSSRPDAGHTSTSSACLIRARCPKRKELVASSPAGVGNSRVISLNIIQLLIALI